MKYCLAIDIGASSGRGVVGWKENGKIVTEEVHRFKNGVEKKDGHLTWDIDHLVNEVKTAVEKAKQRYPLASLSIDTWAVDYVLMKGDREVVPVYAYRDDRTLEIINEVHEKVPFETLYAHTGTQFQPFNSIYQFYADLKSGRLDGVTDYLMIPEYLMYKLCGTKVHEYTNATTTGLFNSKTKTFDSELIEVLGLPAHLFGETTQPGTVIGSYEGIPVILCATHDTASAVEGIPMEGNEPYISSGTWSLLGIRTREAIPSKEAMKANYSNEGGVGYNRFQKNIMGMWLVNRLQEELAPDIPITELVKLAEESGFEETVDANHSDFLAPASMKEAFDHHLSSKPQSIGDYFRCAYRSLALCYKEALAELEEASGLPCHALYIVGGGAKNAFLNRLSEEACGIPVRAYAIEATAIGNLKIQLNAVTE